MVLDGVYAVKCCDMPFVSHVIPQANIWKRFREVLTYYTDCDTQYTCMGYTLTANDALDATLTQMEQVINELNHPLVQATSIPLHPSLSTPHPPRSLPASVKYRPNLMWKNSISRFVFGWILRLSACRFAIQPMYCHLTHYNRSIQISNIVRLALLAQMAVEIFGGCVDSSFRFGAFFLSDDREFSTFACFNVCGFHHKYTISYTPSRSQFYCHFYWFIHFFLLSFSSLFFLLPPMILYKCDCECVFMVHIFHFTLAVFMGYIPVSVS